MVIKCVYLYQYKSTLTERMGCTQQYVSKILKGKENMSLETLSKLEDALGISLVLDDSMEQA